jgi:hypothetical protein
MLENWCWNKESLTLMSAHYKDGSAIDDKLMDDLIKSKNASSGIHNIRYLIMIDKSVDISFLNVNTNSFSVYRIIFFILLNIRQVLLSKMDQHFHTNPIVSLKNMGESFL